MLLAEVPIGHTIKRPAFCYRAGVYVWTIISFLVAIFTPGTFTVYADCRGIYETDYTLIIPHESGTLWCGGTPLYRDGDGKTGLLFETRTYSSHKYDESSKHTRSTVRP